jgi:hypothetical protein
METFVIQLRQAPAGTTDISHYELRGLAEHVGSGRRQPFANADELLAFLRGDHRDLPEQIER